MNAYWKMDPRFRAIEGHITYNFRAGSTSMQSIYFDFSDTLLLDSFYYHGTRMESYERPGGDLLKLNLPSAITAGTIDSITIFYHGIPITTGFGSFTQSSHANDSILWTLSEPYGAKDWFPCKNSLADKMDSADIRIEIPTSTSPAPTAFLQQLTQ
jgi:aminopeptidase N